MDRFTPFPTIHSQTGFSGDDGAVRAILSWPVDTTLLSSELLALSWAVLLRAYTTEESPVFLLNDQPIKADLFTRIIQPATLDTHADLSVKHTAVRLIDEPKLVRTAPSECEVVHNHALSSPSCTLSWYVNRSTQMSTLHSPSGMDTAFVKQLGRQLEHIVQDQAALSGIQVKLPVSTDKLSGMEMELSISNPSPCTLPGPQLLHELALSGAHDGNHAIEFLTADGNVRCLSYRALDRVSSKMAAEINAASKLDAEEPRKFVVPVLVPQSLELYIAQLAILKAGGAFCPLNIDAPLDRIEFILQDVAASVVITQSGLATRIPQKENLAVITVDELETQTDIEDTEIIEQQHSVETTPTDLAYVMYTSGSTGRPKGVGISHLAATQSLLAHNDLIPSFTRFLQFASPTFDVSVFEIFFPLFRGATLIGCDREQMLLDISHVMTSMRVDAAELTPTVAGELLRSRAAAPSLRVLLTIGEMLTRHVVDEFGQSQHTEGILHGMYGPTEAAIHCTAATHFRSDDRVNLIGRAFKTVSAFIMSLESEDKDGSSSVGLQPLPLGQIGELVVGGPQLADGYINRPEENAKAFIESPVYGRLYRTGDKARMLPSGEIECFGRISSGQVKLRGQRIELGEIEHAICRAPDVRSAVAIVSGGSLAAFVLVNDNGTTERALRDVCRQWLPRFMVPGEFILVNQFPQLPSGKIDRKALEAEFVRHRSTAQSVGQRSFRDETEETIASCVADVLGRQLPSTESLSAAGLDSLAAIRLTSHLLDAGFRLDVAHLLEADSVDGIWRLAKETETSQSSEDTQAGLQRIRQLVADAGAARIEALGLSAQVGAIEPCSHIQQAMILETVRHQNAYCNWIELGFQHSISAPAVQDALVKLLEQNSILRSGFIEIGLKDQSYVRFTYHALDESVFQKRDAFDYDLCLIAEHDLLHPLRFQLRETDEGLRLLVHIHHALYDGWSWQLMLKDLHHLLRGEELPPKPAYNVVADFFIEYKLSETATESSIFWRDQLQGSSPASFPNFHGRTDVSPGTQEASRELQISTSKLAEASQSLRVSRQTIFQAAYCYILSTYLGSDDVTFGIVFSGRTLPVKGIENVLGPCIRTLPTRMDLGKMQNATDLLLAIQNMNRKCLEHGSLALQDIKKASGIDLQSNLFDTALVWQESIWSDQEYRDVFREVGAGEFLEFALLLEFEPRDDGIRAKATYQQSVLSREQAEILLEQIDFVASVLIDAPALAIGDLGSRLPQHTLSVVNPECQMQGDLPRLASAVETLASAEYSRTAVECLTELDSVVDTITYGKFNSRANTLANYLLHLGVTGDDSIAMFLEKSIDSYLAVLAIAKIGAGLVPLSPQSSPEDVSTVMSTLNVGFCMFQSTSQLPDGLAILESVRQILLPDSFNDISDDTPIAVDDGFRIICADPTSKEPITFFAQSLKSCVNVLRESYNVQSESKMLFASPAASVDSIIAAFLAWTAGVTLCVAPDEFLANDPQRIVNAMGVTHLYLTPTLASRLDPQNVPSVRYLCTSGEPLTAKVHRDWAGKNLYHGLTTRGIAGLCTVPAEVETSSTITGVGMPLKNISAMVIADKAGFNSLPRGAVGLLCFGGGQVGTSSTEGFFEHPQYGRLYRTRDFGRVLSDGSIVQLGRHTVFYEIDQALLSSDLVQDCVSLFMDDPVTKQQQLVTTWVPSEQARALSHGEQLDDLAKKLLRDLATKLPSSAVPALLVPIDEIPVDEVLFTDRARIQRDIEQMDTELLESFSVSLNDEIHNDTLTDAEKAIATALSAVTGVEQHNIGKHTSFYKLGLDSLSAIAFSRKLQDAGFGRLPVSTILRHSSVAQLANVIPPMTNGHHPDEPISLEQQQPQSSSVFDESFILEVEKDLDARGSSVQGVYPCTPLQEAMLAAESDVDSAYFNHLLLRVNTDIQRLEEAWKQMIQRHEILRTCFRQTNDPRFAYAQVVLHTALLPWISVETSSENFDTDIARRKSDFEHQSPVNGELPYSLAVFEDPVPRSTHLLLSIHHALYDGEGIAQLLHELQASLAGEKLPEATPFHRFVEYMVSVNTDSSDKFWDRYLSDVSPTLLSASKGVSTNGSVSQAASQQIHVGLSHSLASFKQQCRDLSATPLNVFHAAWARLLALHSNATDVCFGNVFSCRTIPLEGADRIVGPCFNTLPMRVKFSSVSTNGDVMKLSQKHNSDILPHQLSALRRIQRRTLQAGSRLFDTLVIFQTRSTELDARYWEMLADEGNMGFPLICEIVPDETRNTIQICIHFQTSHLSHDVAESLARDFVALVEHTTQYPSAQACDKRVVGADLSEIFEKESSRAKINGIPAKAVESRAWSDKEELLRGIVCKFAGVEDEAVSLHTTIFQLGLDSINAVQISGRLRKLGYKVSAGDILEAASIDKIAVLLESTENGIKEATYDFSAFENQHLQSVCEQLGISSQSVQSLRPCTPVQCGMLALFNHSQGNMYYNRMALNSSAPLDKNMLKEAWSKVMAQHEMLRTGFVQLRDQQNPFAMITYREGIDVPWQESPTLDTVSQQQRVLENLHQPPWSIWIEPTDSVTTVHFSAFHALYDAQSLETIFSDVMAAYEGKALTQSASIPETLGPILIESRKQIEHSQEFWQGLATEIHPTKFPDLHPTRIDKKELFTSSILCSQSLGKLEAGCRNAGVTLQAAGQAAWARLLAAYIGEQNVVFGTVLSGRNLSTAAQDAVFPCLVTVPSPFRIEGTNQELLDCTLKRNASLVKNQFTPLAQIQRWLGSDEPLFDTLFVYQKFSTSSGVSDKWEVIDEETKIDYPLSIELLPHDTELEIRISCRSDLVPAEQAVILLNQYNKLLEHTIFSIDSRAEDYLSLGDQFLSVTPAKENKIPTSVSLLHQFVEESARKVPDKPAFEFAFGPNADNLQKKTWSYREFDEDGNRVARYLQDKGVTPGGIIAICFDKCPEASLAILGILKAGCAYLAIDPSAPISRKQFIMEDSSTTLLLCNQSRKSELEALSGVDVQALDEPGKYQHFSPSQPSLAREIQPDDTCYCLYTSGTTGTPKGCEITHDNAVQAMLAFKRLFSPHWDEDSRWLQFASFHFDVSVLEQYWSWSVGICVTSCPRDLLFEDLPGTIQKLEITHIDLTPSLARLVNPDEVPSLRRGVFITGGEQLKQEILDAWGKHGVIYNGYGPTEVTIGCTMLPRMRANDKPSNIGPQFDNVGSYVFRPGTCIPVVRGGLGELCVSGPLVGKGYLNRAELTKERFQTLPENGDRIYRTGDLVRILHDGSFQFLGRIDDQVKLRGQRLEIGEINEVIKQATPELNEVATLVIKHPKQSKDQLVSFVTRIELDKKSRDVEVRFSEEDRALLSTIKAACHTHLPGYMVPTHIIPMTRFPLSANNKAEMKVLKRIYQDLSLEDLQRLSAMAVEQTGKSTQERGIISLLSQFTSSPESAISSWSSIFELGLDSISVIAFARTLREAGFPQAQASLIMKHPTVTGMASALQKSTSSSASQSNLHRNAKQNMEAFAHKHSHSVIESIGVVDSDVEQIAPCTPLQEGILYHFLSSTEPLYCSSFTFALHASTDIEKLRNAWSKAQDQVQMLRARFSPSPDGYAQIILKHDALPWFNAKAASQKQVESLRKQQVENWISEIQELSTRLWEVGVIQSPDRSVMCLNIFHALYDGNSLALLLDLVARIYLGEQSASEDAPQFLNVLHMGPLCKDSSEKSFWKEHLANCRPRSLSKSGQTNGVIESMVQKVQIDSTEHLDRLRKSLNVTEQAVLHACWLLTLHQHYAFVPPIGLIASGRTIDVPGIVNVIGPLFNTIPSNVQLRGLKSWSEVARRCHNYQVSTMPFQYTALRDIMKWLGKSPDDRLFESLFVFQREDADIEASTGSLWQPLDSEAQHEYPLAFEVVRNGNESLTLTLAAKGHVLSSEAAEQLLANFQRILSEFSQNPDHELPYINGVAEESHAYTNGETVMPNGVNGAAHAANSSFQWTNQASTIRDVVATLAGVDAQSISEETSIFEVGLDSIDAIKLSSRLGKLGIKLPVSAIMRYRNVKAMTSQLAVTNHQEQNGSYPLLSQMEGALTSFLRKEGLMPEDACRVLPATPIQEAMVAEMSASVYQNYYNHEVLQLEPHVDLTRLQEAWRAVVKAHSILRTSFVEVWDPEISASYAQIVHNEDAFDVQSVYLNEKSVESIIESQRKRATSELSGRPLLSLTIALDGDARYLVLSISHALYDGWSISLLHEDVARSYSGEDCTRPSADAILEQIIASSGDRALRFWRATLSNCRPTPFPSSEHAEDGSQIVHRAERPLSVSFEKAEGFCKHHGITMQALLVSCWSLILATYVKNLDVIFGLVLSGRNVADSEEVMFPTMNTVAMRVILHGTRLELVKYVQEALLEMSEHQHFPLRRARPDTRSRQLFDTLFIYQKRPSEITSQKATLYHSTGGASGVEYPVCAEVEGDGKNLVARVACRGSVMGEKDTPVLLSHMAEVLLSIVDEPARETVEFSGDAMKICGHLIVSDSGDSGGSEMPEVQTSSQREWSPIESKIRNVLSIVSGVPQDSIDKDANIFQLGLDSISAIKVAALLKKQSVKLIVSDMLKAGTIEKMALAVNKSQVNITQNEIDRALEDSLKGLDINSLLRSYGIDPQDTETTIPATAGQTYFLAMHSLSPDVFYPKFYYLASAKFNPQVLNRAWSRLIDETPILRTAFLATGNLQAPYVQTVLKSVHSPPTWHDDLNHAISIRRDFGSVPVALHVCRTSRGVAFMLHLHHALYDAVSLPHMMNRLAQLCSEAKSELKHTSQNLSHLVAFQHIHSPVDVRRQFWQKYLGQIPTSGANPNRVGEFGAIQHDYRPGLVSNMSRLEIAAKRRGLSIQSIFLAVYARLHSQIFAPVDIDNETMARPLVIGLYLANRSYGMEGLSELVAPTVNIVPLRLDNKLSDNHDSLFIAARKIQEDINEISPVEHAGVSLLEISEWTGVRINTCINFLRLPEVEVTNGDASDKVTFHSISSDEVAPLHLSNTSVHTRHPAETNGDTPLVQATGSASSMATLKEVFWPTIDVEAAIREDRLDFGLFAPSTRLDRPTAEKVMETMRHELAALVASSESP
ncbi:Nonribosomal peptide synthase sidC [Penicillium cataractarum]|uniref:Nonribosomal peptide synthetase sidC n=1 Tax=Penicillium cataractarum TaxID=2100454 RepID=A0A9W9S3A3_9EURO|nr:Nonribosomal peptide synthase sidC [Penicillium cataractarum]KAJ5368803.1 Nonribosomal peptide synthase sidC [Penicillium cataractarum]